MIERDLKRQIFEITLARLGEAPLEEILKSSMNNLLPSCFPAGESVFTELYDELEGNGPVKPLMEDPTISEILINSFENIFFEKEGQLLNWQGSFSTPLTYQRFISRILVKIDRVADRRNPVVDGTLDDGTRVHIVLPPISKTPIISMRRHLHKHWTLKSLVETGFLTETCVSSLKNHLEVHSNILICGPTGAGKTTLLRALIREISNSERVITVEDTDEIGLPSERGVNLLTRMVPDDLVPPINLKDLLRHSLRMRPDRIVVGEIRGDEALIFLDAISTGHKGSLSSVHAQSARQAITRLESLLSRGAPQWPLNVIRQMIYESVDLIICVDRKEKSRQITEIAEIAGIENFGYS